MKKTQTEILKEFNEDMRDAEKLTFDDIEGLLEIEPGDTADAAVEEWINNKRLGIIDEATKALNWTWEKLRIWHSKNWI